MARVSIRRAFRRLFVRRAKGIKALIAEGGKDLLTAHLFENGKIIDFTEAKIALERFNAKKRSNYYGHYELSDGMPVLVTKDGYRIQTDDNGQLYVDKTIRNGAHIDVKREIITNKEDILKYEGLSGWYKDVNEKKRKADEASVEIKKDLDELRKTFRDKAGADPAKYEQLKAELKQKAKDFLESKVKILEMMAERTRFYDEEMTKLGNTKRQAELEIRKARSRLSRCLNYRLINDCIVGRDAKNKKIAPASSLFQSAQFDTGFKFGGRLLKILIPAKKDGNDINIFLEINQEIELIYAHVSDLCYALNIYTDKTKIDMDLMYQNLLSTGNYYKKEIEENLELKNEVAGDYAIFNKVYTVVTDQNKILKERTSKILAMIDLNRIKQELLEKNEFHGAQIKEFFEAYDDVLKIEEQIYKRIEQLLYSNKEVSKEMKYRLDEMEDLVMDIKDAQETGKVDWKAGASIFMMDAARKIRPILMISAVITLTFTFLGVGAIFFKAGGMLASSGFALMSNLAGAGTGAIDRLPEIAKSLAYS